MNLNDMLLTLILINRCITPDLGNATILALIGLDHDGQWEWPPSAHLFTWFKLLSIVHRPLVQFDYRVDRVAKIPSWLCAKSL